VNPNYVRAAAKDGLKKKKKKKKKKKRKKEKNDFYIVVRGLVCPRCSMKKVVFDAAVALTFRVAIKVEK
jgi:hypothetical protein